MEYSRDMIERLDRMTHELSQVKASLVKQISLSDNTKTEKAWESLTETSEEVSLLWSGPSALEDIQEQREK